MRKSPDGSREVVDMQVPLDGSRTRVAVVTGMGLPPKIGVSAIEFPDSEWLSLENRHLSGHKRYDTIQTVIGGLLPLEDRHLQGHDQIFCARGGSTFGTGSMAAKEAPESEVLVRDDDDAIKQIAMGKSAWLVTEKDRKSLLVAPAGIDSFSIVEWMENNMAGEFMIEVVSAGSMTGTGELVRPGWRTLVLPENRLDMTAGMNMRQ